MMLKLNSKCGRSLRSSCNLTAVSRRPVVTRATIAPVVRDVRCIHAVCDVLCRQASVDVNTVMFMTHHGAHHDDSLRVSVSVPVPVLVPHQQWPASCLQKRTPARA